MAHVHSIAFAIKMFYALAEVISLTTGFTTSINAHESLKLLFSMEKRVTKTAPPTRGAQQGIQQLLIILQP